MTEKKRTKKAAEKIQEKTIVDQIKESATVSDLIKDFKDFTQKVKRNTIKRVAITTHPNSDCDGLSSAQAFKNALFELFGIESDVFVSGLFCHDQTRALVNEIGIETKEEEDFKKDEYSGLVLVDTSSLDRLSNGFKKIKNVLIIDTHTIEAETAASATLITLLLHTLKFKFSKKLATALLIGIELDTKRRTSPEFTELDDLACKILYPEHDFRLWAKIIGCGHSKKVNEMLENALAKFREDKETILVAGVGYFNEEYMGYLGEIADYLKETKGKEQVFVIGIMETEIKNGDTTSYQYYLVSSVRTSRSSDETPKLAKKVAGEKDAGGRKGFAGARSRLDSVHEEAIETAKQENDKEELESIFRTYFKVNVSKILKEHEK